MRILIYVLKNYMLLSLEYEYPRKQRDFKILPPNCIRFNTVLSNDFMQFFDFVHLFASIYAFNYQTDIQMVASIGGSITKY